MEGPLEGVHFRDQRIGHHNVVVDELTVLVARPLRHASVHGLLRTHQHFGLAGGVLFIDQGGCDA